MRSKTSLARRVAWTGAVAATIAALGAALITSALAALLLQRAEDRRLQEAAMTLATELDEGPPNAEHAGAIVEDETAETQHTGILFAVLDPSGRGLAGDARLHEARSIETCGTHRSETLRFCRASAKNGLIGVSASAHTLPTSLFVWAALVAAFVAGLLAWIASRPVANATIAPLARLRVRLSTLDTDAPGAADLGPHEQIIEVDQLRDTVEHLLRRVQESIEQARRFAANSAHELRTPLTTIRGELELLIEDTTLGADASENIARVQRKASELALLVERLLILATPRRVASDGAETASLRDLVEDAVASLSPSEPARVAVAGSDALVAGDAVLLQLMIVNALTNALKFGSRVEVELELAGSEAVVRFSDDGPGVQESERERVFEPFFRSSEALSRRVPGHGLGLALIRHIAEAHGGSASFVDGASGARLEIRLPLLASQ